jgi:hypothetical protein
LVAKAFLLLLLPDKEGLAAAIAPIEMEILLARHRDKKIGMDSGNQLKKKRYK